MSELNILFAIFTVSATTFFLRTLPFLGGDFILNSRYFQFLGQAMPTGIMFLLITYTLKDLQIAEFPYGIPYFTAMLLTALLYWKTNHSLLAIMTGLFFYLITINFIL